MASIGIVPWARGSLEIWRVGVSKPDETYKILQIPVV